MSEPNIEDIVARIERCPYPDMEGGDLIDIPYVRMLESAVADCRALIASWRERGEALVEAEAVLSIVMPRSNAAEYRRVLGVVRAALKDKP